jgi:hypothetical protein
MKEIERLGHPPEPFEVALAPVEAGKALNIAGVYQDSVTRDWATQICRRATRLAEQERVQNSWHDVHSLADPVILLDAVSAALVADVIVVSVYAAEELPLDLYVWVDAWLPRRLLRAGALTALIGVAESPDSQFVRTIEYLQAVAHKAQLNFVPQPLKRTAASAAASMDRIAQPGSANAQALHGTHGRRYDGYGRWGLNE